MRILQLSFVLSLWLLSALVYAQSRPWEQFEFPPINNFDIPELEIFELANGVRFYLLEDRELPLIDVNVLIRAGGIQVPDDKVGLNNLVGAVMRSGGTEQYPGDLLNELLENRAAMMETEFGFTSGSARMNVLSNDFAELLPVFVDLLMNPAFPLDRIELAKTQQRSTIARRNDDQANIASREFQSVIYGNGSRYARRIEYATLDNILRDDLIAFHRQALTAGNLMIGVTGDFELQDMKTLLSRAFSVIPAGEKQVLSFPEVDYQFDNQVYFVDKSDVNQSYILLGHIGGLRSSPDYAALQVMNRILSGGFSSRLMQVVRSEMGLAYAVFGSYGSGLYFPGTFSAGVMTQSDTTVQAIQAIIGQIERLQQEPVSDDELLQTKDQFLNTLVFQYPSVSSVLRERMNNDYAGLPPDTFEQLVEQIREVTVADVQAVARRYLRADSLRILVVGNSTELGDQLDVLGNVQQVDISILQ
jgi:zinc protease